MNKYRVKKKKMKEAYDLFAIFSLKNNQLIELKKQEGFRDNSLFKEWYVRGLFTMIEGTAYGVRNYMILGVENDIFKLSEKELFVLIEKKYVLQSNGRIEEKDSYCGFLSMFRFTFLTFSKLVGKEEVYEEANSTGAENFKKLIDVRNRLTHPKSIDDLFINEYEIELSFKVFNWYKSLLLQLFKDNLIEKHKK